MFDEERIASSSIHDPVNWRRIFYSHVSIFIADRDFGSIDCALDLSSEIIRCLNEISYFGEDKSIVRFMESKYYLGLRKTSHSDEVTIHFSGLDSNLFSTDNTRFFQLDFLQICEAAYSFHQELILRAVEIYPDLKCSDDFMTNCPFVRRTK